MTPEQINEVLAEYGASLDADGYIFKGRRFGIRVLIKSKRLEYWGETYKVKVAHSPKTAEGIRKFVEKYWFWEKLK